MIASLRRQPPGFYRRLWILASPMVLQNLVTTSLGFVDTFMVGLLGNEAMSAVTLANVPLFILQLLIFGMQSGSSVLISQYWGKRDMDSISRIIGVGFYAAGGVSLLAALLLLCFPHQVMVLTTNNPALQELGAPYLQIVGISYVFNSLTSIYVGAHRSVENPKLGATVFGISMLLNTVLNYVLIFGKFGAPALGIVGAAVATLTARVVEFLITLVCALRSRLLPLTPAVLLRPGLAALREFVRYSTPVICNETLWGAGSSMFSVIMGHMANSTDMVAAYTIVGYIDKLSMVVLFGLAGAAAVTIGKATGAGEEKNSIFEMGKALLAIALLVGALVGAFLLVLLPLLLRPVVFPLFQLSAEGVSIASTMLIVTAVLFPLRSFDVTNVVGILRGGGDVAVAMVIDILPLWGVAVPAMAIAALVLRLDVIWICLAYQTETMVKCPTGLIRLYSKKWIKPIINQNRP